MSFEEYKRATEKITDQSMNIYGTSSSGRLSGSSDPHEEDIGVYDYDRALTRRSNENYIRQSRL